MAVDILSGFVMPDIKFAHFICRYTANALLQQVFHEFNDPGHMTTSVEMALIFYLA